ncbi:hypothetical protein, partial [Streptomyces noursei]|uniref:hypothetical protein n=1 Tax=Streptomyces noursei TaxID=1971 RepID=UPI000AE559A6
WTWNHVAGPVLDRWGRPGPAPDGRWARLWWSPGGARAPRPLHAAGHHGEATGPAPREAAAAPAGTGPAPRTVLDRVVSSYTPTVGAIRYARARAAAP